MKRVRIPIPIVAVVVPLLAFACGQQAGEDADGTAAGYGDHEHAAFGTVHFSTSCAAEVEDDFNTGMAALHSFAWGEATAAFEKVLAEDPNCAMAHWGIASTHAKIAWGPAYFSLEPGLAAIGAAQEIGAPTEREQGFIDALAALYEGAERGDHAGGVRDHVTRMRALHEQFPDDDEVALFYALGLLSSAAPGDTTFAVQRQAGAIADRVFAAQPDHPGPPHYLIHAFDYQPLAREALPAADRYAEIAPAAPHARHMPSHIYARLGMWEETIASNRAALEVAETSPIAAAHSLDYLVYAHLQRGEVAAAEEALAQLRALGEAHPQHYDVMGHVVDAHARFALEQQDWDAAASLALDPDDLQNPRFDAIVHYTQSIAAARSGDVDAARAHADELPKSRAALEAKGEAYPAANVAYWTAVAEAWIAHAAGDDERALARMREAVALDEETVYVGSFEFGPDAMVHAREELGDLLLEMGRPAEARAAYEAALEHSPNRRRAQEGQQRAGIA